MSKWEVWFPFTTTQEELLNVTFTQYVVNIKDGNTCPKTEFLYLSTVLISGQSYKKNLKLYVNFKNNQVNNTQIIC